MARKASSTSGGSGQRFTRKSNARALLIRRVRRKFSHSASVSKSCRVIAEAQPPSGVSIIGTARTGGVSLHGHARGDSHSGPTHDMTIGKKPDRCRKNAHTSNSCVGRVEWRQVEGHRASGQRQRHYGVALALSSGAEGFQSSKLPEAPHPSTGLKTSLIKTRIWQYTAVSVPAPPPWDPIFKRSPRPTMRMATCRFSLQLLHPVQHQSLKREWFGNRKTVHRIGAPMAASAGRRSPAPQTYVSRMPRLPVPAPLPLAHLEPAITYGLIPA